MSAECDAVGCVVDIIQWVHYYKIYRRYRRKHQYDQILMLLIHYRSDDHKMMVLCTNNTGVSKNTNWNYRTSVRLGHHGETAQVNCSNTEEGRICNDGAISVPIENITVHSNYSAAESWKNDIAIIKLNDTVQYSGEQKIKKIMS